MRTGGQILVDCLRNEGAEIAFGVPGESYLAVQYGGHGERVEKTQDFPAAFKRARESGKPAIIEVMQDPECINPNTTLSDIRFTARKTRKS